MLSAGPQLFAGSFLLQLQSMAEILTRGLPTSSPLIKHFLGAETFTQSATSLAGIQMGVGSVAQTIMSGTVCLGLKVGKLDRFITLHDVLYVPSIPNNLCSISSIRKQYRIQSQGLEFQRLFTC